MTRRRDAPPALKPRPGGPLAAEYHAPAELPRYPTPTAADDAVARQAIATCKAIVAEVCGRMGPRPPVRRPESAATSTRPRLVPIDVDPGIRAACDAAFAAMVAAAKRR